MGRVSSKLAGAYWAVTLATLVCALLMAWRYAPTEASMGVSQKIFYLHLPVAVGTFLAAFVSFASAAAYIWTRSQRWDDLSNAGARVAVLYCTVVLVTGMIWARSEWNVWWTWSPRLTFSFLLWLLYAAYLVLRPSIRTAERRALVAGVYSIVAFVDVPLVYLSVKLLPDIHPSSVELDPRMARTLLVWFVPVTLICAGLIAARFRLARRESGLGELGAAP